MKASIADTGTIGYMCRVDFVHELGAAMGGNTVYPNVEDCKKHRKCVDTCGIVEVEVRLRRIVLEGDIWSKTT